MKKYYKVAGLMFTISGQDEGYNNALTDYFSDKESNEAQESPLLERVVSSENNDVGLQPDYFSLADLVLLIIRHIAKKAFYIHCFVKTSQLKLCYIQLFLGCIQKP